MMKLKLVAVLVTVATMSFGCANADYARYVSSQTDIQVAKSNAEAAKYNAMAAVIAPGNSFDIPLSESGAEPVSHYGAVVSITEDAKAQLLALELFGGTQSSGVQTLFYVRCDAETSTAVYTNIGGFAVGGVCSLGSVLTALNLKEMGV